MSILGINFSVEIVLCSFHSFTLQITLPTKSSLWDKLKLSGCRSKPFSLTQVNIDGEILFIILRITAFSVSEDQGNFHPYHPQTIHADLSNSLHRYLTYSFPVLTGQLLMNSLQVNHEQLTFQICNFKAHSK